MPNLTIIPDSIHPSFCDISFRSQLPSNLRYENNNTLKVNPSIYDGNMKDSTFSKYRMMVVVKYFVIYLNFIERIKWE